MTHAIAAIALVALVMSLPAIICSAIVYAIARRLERR